jgi:Mg-chelatase subunit ChlI
LTSVIKQALHIHVMKNTTPKEFCDLYNACRDGRDFAMQYLSMADVWDNCQRVDWLGWILDHLGVAPDQRKVREFMCWAATETPLADGRKTLDLLTDERSLNAVNVALRFARNEANAEELSAARSAAWSAAWSAARSAARSAAWSAAESAARSAAESAAWSAARSAARSAAWSAAESAARSAAESAARSAQTARFREVFPNPFR